MTQYNIGISAAAICLTALLASGCKDKPSDYSEYFTGYDDRISFIVEGYQMHWEGFSPEDMSLSTVYGKESPDGGFVKYDIDSDGTDELLLGEQGENGDYRIYDIFTFDKSTGEIIHLFCGDESDNCTLNGSGVIIETVSGSEKSSTKCYVLKSLKLMKLGKDEPVTLDLLALEFDKFVNYSRQEQMCGAYTQQRELSGEDIALFESLMGKECFTPLSVATQVVAGINYKFLCSYLSGESSRHCTVTIWQHPGGDAEITAIEDEDGGPEMKIIVDDKGNVGRYVGEDETSYFGQIQDDYSVSKESATVKTVSAREGYGVLFSKTDGNISVLSRPCEGSEQIAEIVYDSTYLPEPYECRGYVKGWFLVEVAGKAGFVKEEAVWWDSINTF